MGITSENTPEEIANITPNTNTGWEHVRLYRTHYDGTLRFPSAEVDAAMWFPLSEITAWTASHPEDFAPGFLECWSQFHSI